MSESTKYLLITTVVAFAAAAFVLWFVDLLYTDRTGRPASERVREREKRAKPLTIGNYRFQVGLNAVMLVAWSILLWFERGRSSDRLVLPIVMTLMSAVQLWQVNRQWWRQQSSAIQSSEAAT